MEWEVEDGPELLAEGWEFGVFHPVEVDEEDEVDCCGRCGEDSDCLRVFSCLLTIEKGQIIKHQGSDRVDDLLQASGFFTIVTTF